MSPRVSNSIPTDPRWIGKTLSAHRLSDLNDGMVRNFQASIYDATRPQTSFNYQTQVRQFLSWAEQTGLTLQTLPHDALERYYTARGWLPNNSVRNAANAAVAAFLRYLPTTGVHPPDVGIPPSVKPPARKPRTVTGYGTTDNGEAPSAYGETMNGGLNGGAPTAPTAPATGAPEAPETFPQGVQLEAPPPGVSQLGPVPRTPEALPASVQPAAQGTMIPPGATVQINVAPPAVPNAMRSPAIVGRGRGPKSALAAMLPEGGTLRVLRVSDGTDGLSVGNRMPVGDYTEVDLRGYQDIQAFLREVVHPGMAPLMSTRTVTYVVEHYNSAGSLQPPPRRFSLPNGPGAGYGAPGNGYGQGPNGYGAPDSFTPAPPPAPHSAPTVDVSAKIAEVEARLTAQLSQLATRADAVNDPARMQAVRFEMAALQAEAKTEVRRLLDDARDEAKAIRAVPVSQNLGPIPQSSSDRLIQQLVGEVSALARERQAEAAKPAAVLPPAPDMLEVLTRARSAGLLPPIVTPGPTSGEIELRMRLERQDAELKSVLAKLEAASTKPAPTLGSMLADMNALDEFMSRRGGGGGGLEALAGAPPDALKGLAEVITAGKPAGGAAAGAAASTPVNMRGKKAAAPPPQAQATPVNVEAALRAIIDSDTEQKVVDNVRELIAAMAQAGGRWTELVGGIVSELKGAETVDELQSLVVKVYRTCGAKKLLVEAPGASGVIGSILAKHFAEICKTIGIPARKILGVDDGESDSAEAEEEETEAAQSAAPATGNGMPGTSNGTPGAPTAQSAAPSATVQPSAAPTKEAANG